MRPTILCSIFLVATFCALTGISYADTIIDRILINGLVTVEEPVVRLTISSRRGMPHSEELLKIDLKALKKTGLFSNLSCIAKVIKPGHVHLVFHLLESPIITKVSVHGVSLINKKKIEALGEKLMGKTPSAKDLETIAHSIEKLYRAAGWFACGLTSKDGARLTTDGNFQLTVREPSLGKIRIEGLHRVRRIEIQRRLVLEHKKPVRLDAMKRSVHRLGILGTLRSAVFSIDKISDTPPRVDLVLKVQEETHTGELAYGLRYTTVDRTFGTLELTKRNLFNKGKTLTLESELGGRMTYEGKISTEWFLGEKIGADASLFRQKYSREFRQDNLLTSAFDERRRGIGFTLRKKLPHGLSLRFKLADENVSATATDGTSLPVNLAAIGGNPFSAEYEQQSLQITASRGPYLLPLSDTKSHASYFELDFVGGPLKGPADYLRFRGGKRILFSRGKRNRLGLRVEVGGIHLQKGILPFLETLTLGGGETLRGFEYKEFTGNRLLLSNLEFRRKLSERFEGVAFFDWGDCWSDKTRGFKGKKGFGLGLRIDLSIFQLRIDAAHGVGRDGTQITFGVGHLF